MFFLSFAFAVYAYSVDLEYGWDREDMRVRTLKGYDYLGVEGSIFPNTTLGEISDLRIIPGGYKVDSFEVLREEWEEIGTGYRVGAISDGVAEAMMAEDAGGLENVVAGDLLGYGVINSVVKPFRYQEGRVSMLKRLDVRVSCSPDENALTVGRRSEILNGHLGELVAELAGTEAAGQGDWLVEGSRDWVSESPTMDGGVVDCIIVTDDALVSEFETLAAWHDRFGIRTVVRTVSWIDSEYPGGDSPERVRNFLKDAYQNWGTVYVLMGGAPDIVPIRYAWTNHYGGAFIPTDLYYANLDGNWNADGNDIFGEFTDEVTFYPNLLLGRAPVKTPAEAQIFVNKTISYVTEVDPEFITSSAFLGEVIFPEDWTPGDDIYLDGGVICDSAAAYLPAYYDTLKLYQRFGDMNRTTCIQALDHGYAFNVIAGHGDAFRTSAAEGTPPFIALADFDTLANDKRFGFIYALNCNNAAVDVDCVFRHYLMNPTGG
ncbi:MAG: C25 family cysteine peptidase, partial [bacterium]